MESCRYFQKACLCGPCKLSPIVMYTRTLVKCGVWVQLCDVYQNAREMRCVGAAV
jgi:hypothetical protein